MKRLSFLRTEFPFEIINNLFNRSSSESILFKNKFTNSNYHPQHYWTFTGSSISTQQLTQPLTALPLSPCSLLNRAKNSFKTICYVCIILTANIKHSARVRNKRRFRFHPCAQCKLPRKCMCKKRIQWGKTRLIHVCEALSRVKIMRG